MVRILLLILVTVSHGPPLLVPHPYSQLLVVPSHIMVNCGSRSEMVLIQWHIPLMVSIGADWELLYSPVMGMPLLGMVVYGLLVVVVQIR